VPRQDDPGIVACSFIASGLRVFDIRDPYKPKEVAYFVAPPAPSPVVAERSNFAMSKPSFGVARRTVWYSDGNSGLYAVRLTNGAWPAKSAPRCVHRRSFVLRLPRGKRVGELAVVRIVGPTRAGERVVRTRRYRAC
jgi:hypothetical protein